LPAVFVVILNWNGREWLEDCLASVLGMDYPNFEVVVVDNGSIDSSVAFVRDRFPSVHVVCNEHNLGYSAGFNRGLEFARERGADYFLVMNNDTVIDRSALEALVETASRQDRAGFVTGKAYFQREPDVLQTVGKLEDAITWSGNHIGWGERDVGQYDALAERAFLDDVFTLVSAEMYDEIGGYDAQLFLQCEEFDWQARAKRSGWRLYYTPAAKLWHGVSMSMGGLDNPVGRYFDTRSRIVVMAKHADTVQFLRFYAWSWYMSLRGLAGALVREPARLKPSVASVLGLLGGTLWLVHRRAPVRPPRVLRCLS
jgi:GT2 family glycosyltransferase